MTGSTKTLIGTALGLTMMQLILSTSEQGGKSGQLLGGMFQLPAKWLRSFIDPTKPGVPSLDGSDKAWQDVGGLAPQLLGGIVGNGLSGVPTTTGTGSNVMNV